MKWKSTLVLVLATIGLGVYVSQYELKQPTQERRQELDQQVVDLSPDETTQVILELPEAKLIMTKDAGVWRLQPRGLRINRDELARVLDRLNPLNAERTLPATPEQPVDLKSFGLDPAIGVMSVTANGVATTLRFGEPTAVGGRQYVQVEGSPNVHIVDGAIFDEANQPADHFRDMRLMPMDSWAADHISVTMPQNSFVMNRRDDKVWWLNEPVSDRAERDQVNVFITTLSAIKVARVLDNPVTPEALPAWGLDAPVTSVTVGWKDGPPAGVTVSFGKPLPDDAALVYARRTDEPVLYAVAAADMAGLSRDPHGLRQLITLNFFTAQTTKVQLERDGTPAWTLVKTDNVWRVEGSPGPLESFLVEQYLNKVADQRIGGFVDEKPVDLAKYGLNPPAAVVSVWTNHQDTPQRLFVGSVVEGSDNRYARIEGREMVVRMPPAIEDVLEGNPEEFRPGADAPVPASPVR